MRKVSFAKGHGTGNDFVILRDRGNKQRLSDHDVRHLCDRHFGIGADGILRAVKAEYVDGWTGDPELWFMDYRNADGSIAEMCGNGVRVFVRYLAEENLFTHERIATRAGERAVTFNHDGTVSVEMGEATVGGEVEIALAGRQFSATSVDVGNPHAVVVVDDDVALAELPVEQPPTWLPTSTFPDGVNVEFVAVRAPREISLRVHERGSGETLSCGTGVVAAAAAHARASGEGDGDYHVRVPGGQLRVGLRGRAATLTGPAVIVARGETSLPDHD